MCEDNKRDEQKKKKRKCSSTTFCPRPLKKMYQVTGIPGILLTLYFNYRHRPSSRTSTRSSRAVRGCEVAVRKLPTSQLCYILQILEITHQCRLTVDKTVDKPVHKTAPDTILEYTLQPRRRGSSKKWSPNKRSAGNYTFTRTYCVRICCRCHGTLALLTLLGGSMSNLTIIMSFHCYLKQAGFFSSILLFLSCFSRKTALQYSSVACQQYDQHHSSCGLPHVRELLICTSALVSGIIRHVRLRTGMSVKSKQP